MVKLLYIGIFLIGLQALANEHAAKEEHHEAEAHSSEEAHDNLPKEVVSEIAKDIKIPLKIWDLLAEHKKVETNEVYIFSEVKVRLKQKNLDTVKKVDFKIEFPRGGGEIDFATYLTGKQGSFFVTFDFPEFEDASSKKVFFISNSRKRKIDDHVFGSGCHEFFDITDHFLKENKGEGIKVNTTRQRHVSVLAGSFILIAKKNKQNYLTQVTFTDRDHKNLLCQEN